MRVILVLLIVVGLTAWGGFALWQRDRIASLLLFAFSAAVLVGLVGAFYGWF